MSSSSLNFREYRSLQICTVFVCTIALQRVLQFSHSGWIGFAVMMIYAGFDSGASLHRAIHRFWGAMLGLFLSYILFFFIRFNDDIIWLVIPSILFMAYYTLSKYYVSPTIFTVTLTALGSDYYSSTLYPVDQFFFDYGRATAIAMAICMIFEKYIFNRKNMTERFYTEIQSTVIDQLEALLQVTLKKNLNHAKFLKLSNQINTSVVRLDAFLKTVSHNHLVPKDLFNSLSEFNIRIEHIYRNIRHLYIEHGEEVWALQLETQKALKTLVDKFQSPVDEDKST